VANTLELIGGKLLGMEETTLGEIHRLQFNGFVGMATKLPIKLLDGPRLSQIKLGLEILLAYPSLCKSYPKRYDATF
jgi:hypothetical protein